MQIVQLAAFEYGLLGVIAAVGLVRLRTWGWWCTVVWTSIFAAGFGRRVLWFIDALASGRFSREAAAAEASAGILVAIALIVIIAVGLLWIGTIVFLVWSLATQRRSFFPPKPEGEE